MCLSNKLAPLVVNSVSLCLVLRYFSSTVQRDYKTGLHLVLWYFNFTVQGDYNTGLHLVIQYFNSPVQGDYKTDLHLVLGILTPLCRAITRRVCT